jgi:hypothetical protein
MPTQIFVQSLDPETPSSMKTFADAPSGETTGQWGIIQNASGMSNFYSSGKTIYYWGGSTLSAVQP